MTSSNSDAVDEYSELEEDNAEGNNTESNWTLRTLWIALEG